MFRRVVVGFCMAVAVNGAIDDPEWDKFKAAYKKKYDSDADEEARYKLFKESKIRIAKLNEANGQPAFGINWMSDRYEDEKYKKGLKKPEGFKPTAPVKEFSSPRSPTSINWRYTEA